jgi:hypothetical protein
MIEVEKGSTLSAFKKGNLQIAFEEALEAWIRDHGKQ